MDLKPPFTLPGVNVMLMGPAGTGKTYSIGTLVDLGIETFYLAIESGMESLLGYWTDRKLEVPKNLHWHKLKAPTASLSEMISSAKNINQLPLDALAKMVDPHKSKHNQFITLLEALNNFKDDRTGQEFGDITTWDQSKCLVIDGLTGISQCAISLVVGGKAVRSQSDWGIGQNQVMAILRMLCETCPCHFVLISHVERQTDEVLGGVKIMVSTLGKAITGDIPIMFSDVILAVRQGATWKWDTASALADVKTRNLPITGENPPTFKTIFEKWYSRNKTNSDS